MVELAEIQAAYYMVAATGVLVAAMYYILNLKETMKNRRATFANNLQQFWLTEEGQQRYMEVLNMQFSDFEDFKRKYDSSVSSQLFAKRGSILTSYDTMGRQYRDRTIELNMFGSATAFAIVIMWLKFKPIIEGYRGWQYPKDAYSDFEYLANALQKVMVDNDPECMKKINTLFTTPLVAQ
jgi:hypothetical protein